MKRLTRSVLVSSLFSFFALASPALANGFDLPNPPAQVTRASYLTWLNAIHSNVSAFHNVMFSWYEEQLRSNLPSQVNADPDKLYVAVDRALRETIELEDSGEIETGNTIGFEAYGILNVPIEIALETKLFNWGKPVGQREGDTYSFDTVFSSRHDWISEKWGAGNYYSGTEQTGGGLVQSLRDDFTLLVRGNATDGYVLFAEFFAPNGETATQAHTSIVMLKPLPNGKTEFRQNARQNGQSYKMFGLEYGRRNFGFNVTRIRQGEKALADTMLELKNTGKIKENKPSF
jgi:hypothetical protein